MPCCASGACSTGACDVAFDAPAKKPEADSHCEHDGSLTGHDAAMQMEGESSQKEISDELCGADNSSRLSGIFKQQDVTHQESAVKPHAFSQPCPTECGAGAGAFQQFRRSRELAILGHAQRPRPPTRVSSFDNISLLASLNNLRRRQSPPRAPPLLPDSFAA